MGRLINADNIKGYAKYIKTNEKFEPYIMIDDLSKLLDEQPTAYSVDKVVEELEEAKHEICLSDDDLEYYQNGIDEAIEIVKQCGVSDDVCEWNKSKDYPFDWLVGCDGCEVSHRQGDYCPRCGKKIKAVE